MHWDELDSFLCRQLGTAQQHVAIYSPFVSVTAVRRITAHISPGVQVRVLVRWRVSDFLAGVADLELYSECVVRGWQLRAHPDLHFKTFVCDGQTLSTGSMNLTDRGLGTCSRPNLETLVGPLPAADAYCDFLHGVWEQAKEVDAAFIEQLRSTVEAVKERFPDLADCVEAAEWDLDRAIPSPDAFLISHLPMSTEWQTVYAVAAGRTAGLDEEALECAKHDLRTYGLSIRRGEPSTAFRERLRAAFLKQPFVASLVQFIDRPRRFGAVKEWIQRTCRDVPIPSRRDITGNVQVLFRWLIEFSNGAFQVSRPGYSEIIHPSGVPLSSQHAEGRAAQTHQAQTPSAHHRSRDHAAAMHDRRRLRHRK